MLHHRYPGEAREREPVLRRLEAIAYGMHTGEEGSALRTIPAPEISWVETERLLARFGEVNPAYEKGSVGPAVQREELLTRSGLLLPRPKERVAFYHLSLQEFLAAQRIIRTSNDLESVFRARVPVAEWRSTLLFLFAAQVFNKDPEWGLGLLDHLIAEQHRAAVKANPSSAAFIGETRVVPGEGLPRAGGSGRPLSPAQPGGHRRRNPGTRASNARPGPRPAGRSAYLRSARLPRLRQGVPWYLSLWRSGRDYRDHRSVPNRPLSVTNSQYEAFLNDTGYSHRQWWSDDGWAWLQNKGVTEPRYWRNRRWNVPNQPVVGVSFWEAEACSKWAGGHLPRKTGKHSWISEIL